MTEQTEIDARELWTKVLDHQKKLWEEGKKRHPVTVLSNRRTLNIVVVGFDDDRFARFEKVSFKGSWGDIYFHEHRLLNDGEVVIL